MKNVNPKRNNVPAILEEEPAPQQVTRLDVEAAIKDCLSRCSKDGLAWSRMENVENCFW